MKKEDGKDYAKKWQMQCKCAAKNRHTPGFVKNNHEIIC